MGALRSCPDCNGTGYDFGDGGQCDRCGGMGEYYDEFYDPDDDEFYDPDDDEFYDPDDDEYIIKREG